MDYLLDILIFREYRHQILHEETVYFYKKLLYNVLKEKEFEDIRLYKRKIKGVLKSYHVLTDWRITPSQFKILDKKNEIPYIVENGKPYEYNTIIKLMRKINNENSFIDIFFNMFD